MQAPSCNGEYRDGSLQHSLETSNNNCPDLRGSGVIHLGPTNYRSPEGRGTKVLQGPSEPYSEFVDRLLQLAGRMFGDADNAMPIQTVIGGPLNSKNLWLNGEIFPRAFGKGQIEFWCGPEGLFASSHMIAILNLFYAIFD
ncbi:Retroviral nucleocapsid protein Gag containing protein [Cricetulus griseus]|nr:Retroviral nucleocapsid protein Gag containing protein [Cricetulus griseus]